MFFGSQRGLPSAALKASSPGWLQLIIVFSCATILLSGAPDELPRVCPDALLNRVDWLYVGACGGRDLLLFLYIVSHSDHIYRHATWMAPKKKALPLVRQSRCFWLPECNPLHNILQLAGKRQPIVIYELFKERAVFTERNGIKGNFQ